jgi:TonB family protein
VGPAVLAAPPIDEICPGAAGALSSAKFPLNAAVSVSKGNVEVDFTIRTDGSVADVLVFSSSDPSFEAPALQVISKLSCTPQPLERRLRLPMDFSRPLSMTPETCSNFESVMRELGYPRDTKGYESADVLIEFTMTADGQIPEFYVLRSTHEVFTAVALQGLAKLKCTGLGQEARFRVPFSFRLY